MACCLCTLSIRNARAILKPPQNKGLIIHRISYLKKPAERNSTLWRTKNWCNFFPRTNFLRFVSMSNQAADAPVPIFPESMKLRSGRNISTGRQIRMSLLGR